MPRKNLGPRLEINERGYYEIHWSERGRSKRGSTGTKDLAEAQAELAAFLTGARDYAAGRMRVRDVVDLYLELHIDADPKVRDKQRPRDGLTPVKEFMGDDVLSDVDKKRCLEYAAARRAGKIGAHKRKVSDTTINYEMTMLSVACAWCVENKHMEKGQLPILDRPEKAPPRADWITKDIYRKIIELVPITTPATKKSPARLTRLYRFLVIAFNTAQRRRSIEVLEWYQVNFETGLIDFNKRGQVQTAKNKPTVPMSTALRDMLRQAWEERLNDDWVLDFPGSIRKTFDNWRVKAGVAWVTRHTIRRTWATWAAMRGVSLYDIADVLGDTYETVWKHYRKFHPDHLRGAVEGSTPAAATGAEAGALCPDPGTSPTTKRGQKQEVA